MYNPLYNNIIGGPPNNAPSPKGWKARLANARDKKARHEYEMDLVAIRRPFIILQNCQNEVMNAERNFGLARHELDRLRGCLEVNLTQARTGKYNLKSTIEKLKRRIACQEEVVVEAEQTITDARARLAAHEATMRPPEPAHIEPEAPLGDAEARKLDDAEARARETLSILEGVEGDPDLPEAVAVQVSILDAIAELRAGYARVADEPAEDAEPVAERRGRGRPRKVTP